MACKLGRETGEQRQAQGIVLIEVVRQAANHGFCTV